MIRTNFLEIVAPVKNNTAAGRYLDRRKGDGGYMVICQVATKKEQDHAIKIHPRIIKKLFQMASRGTLQTPSEPLGNPFGHSPYFKTLLDVIFRHFGSTLASLGAPFWKPFGLLCLSWGFQETKIDEF